MLNATFSVYKSGILYTCFFYCFVAATLYLALAPTVVNVMVARLIVGVSSTQRNAQVPHTLWGMYRQQLRLNGVSLPSVLVSRRRLQFRCSALLERGELN